LDFEVRRQLLCRLCWILFAVIGRGDIVSFAIRLENVGFDIRLENVVVAIRLYSVDVVIRLYCVDVANRPMSVGFDGRLLLDAFERFGFVDDLLKLLVGERIP
jgi:hypothetical protein